MSAPQLLAVDVGNTNVSIGVFDYAEGKGQLAHHWRIGTHREQTSDEVAVTLRGLFAHSGCDETSFTDVIISSVVPPLAPIWERVCRKLLDRPPLIVGPGIRTGMPVRYENPREVGADLTDEDAEFATPAGVFALQDHGRATIVGFKDIWLKVLAK